MTFFSSFSGFLQKTLKGNLGIRICYYRLVRDRFHFNFIFYKFLSGVFGNQKSRISRAGGTTVKVGRLKTEMSFISLGNGEKSYRLLKSGEAEASPVSPLPPGLISQWFLTYRQYFCFVKGPRTTGREFNGTWKNENSNQFFFWLWIAI